MQKIIITEKGYIEDRIPFVVYEELLQSLNIKDKDSKPTYHRELVGQIETELDVTKIIPKIFHQYLIYLADSYYKNFPLSGPSNHREYQFGDSWLNYQKKYEFNPVHVHSGSLSYVVWIKIPYKLEEEFSLPNSLNTPNPHNSLFSFVLDNVMHPIRVNSSLEGHIIMFDAGTPHTVYPFFTSDDYRISLAGNIFTNWLPNP